MPNVEDNELFYPLLYLWRKEITNSGGAGKFRGGNAAEIAYVLNDTDNITHYTTGGHTMIPGPGLFGGDPTSRTRYLMLKDAGLAAALADSGRMPGDLGEVGGEQINISPKTGGVVQGQDDVFCLAWTSAGGYGDPLERDPAKVVRDVSKADVSESWAKHRHGVCLEPDGTLNASATRALREKLRQERLSRGSAEHFAGGRCPESPDELRVSEGLALARSDGRTYYTCRKCRARIHEASGNYKNGCIRTVTDVRSVGLESIDPAQFIDDVIEYREYFCPGCGLLMQGHFCKPEDEDLWDIRLSNGGGCDED